MNNNEKQKLQNIKRLMIARYPNFAQQIASAKLTFNRSITSTAATDGKDVYFNPDFFETLSDEDRLFIIAHELMHIKFEHMFRMTDKKGEKRDMYLWNIATDAIINANLEKDGFKIKEGYVNMPEAVNFTAEELYEKLKKEKEKQQEQNQNGQGKNGENKNQGQQNQDQQNQSGGQGQQQQGQSNNQQKKQQNQGGKQQGGQDGQSQNGKQQGKNQGGQGGSGSSDIQDDHGLWEEANIKRIKDEKTREAFSKIFKKQEQEKDPPKEKEEISEKADFEQNRTERRERAKQKLEEKKNAELKKTETKQLDEGLGEEKPILDWRLVLRREVEKSETIWSQRRSIAENNYAYRLEENDEEDEAETEVMIDVSGSVSDSMVRSFLRQLKPILKNSKLKVGFFADYTTKQFQEVKTDKDIDKITIYRPGYGTNLDGAVRAFSKKPEVNKIVFTDGWPGTMPREDLKKTNVIWIVYDNRNYNPCCGKVVQVSEQSLKQIKCLNSKEKQDPEM